MCWWGEKAVDNRLIIMLLHKYFGSHAYETLKEAKLKTSRITSFNDPFEFLFVTKGKITAKIAHDYALNRFNQPDFLPIAIKLIPELLTSNNPKKLIRKNLPRLTAFLVKNSEEIVNTPLKLREQMADKSTRIVSFTDAETKPLNQILLWSHYAKKHEGVRIGFDFPDGIKFPFKIFKVIYQDKRFEIDFAQGITSMNIGHALVDSAKVKSSAWSYENEYRLMTHPDVCEKILIPDIGLECFLAFERAWIKSVDFGIRCPEEVSRQIIDLIKTDYNSEILLRKSVFHKTEYALEYVPI